MAHSQSERKVISLPAKPVNDFWGLVDALRKPPGDDVPAHAITNIDYAKRYGIARKTAEQQLKSFVDDGVMKSGMAYRTAPNGHRQLMRCYWLAAKQE